MYIDYLREHHYGRPNKAERERLAAEIVKVPGAEYYTATHVERWVTNRLKALRKKGAIPPAAAGSTNEIRAYYEPPSKPRLS